MRRERQTGAPNPTASTMLVQVVELPTLVCGVSQSRGCVVICELHKLQGHEQPQILDPTIIFFYGYFNHSCYNA